MLLILQALVADRLGMVRGLRILEPKVLEMFLAGSSITMSQVVRIGLDIPRGILERPVRMSSHRLQ